MAIEEPGLVGEGSQANTDERVLPHPGTAEANTLPTIPNPYTLGR